MQADRGRAASLRAEIARLQIHAEHGRIGVLPETMSVYRQHKAGIWSQRASATRTLLTGYIYYHLDEFFDHKYRYEFYNKYMLAFYAAMTDQNLEELRTASPQHVPQFQDALRTLTTTLQRYIDAPSVPHPADLSLPLWLTPPYVMQRSKDYLAEIQRLTPILNDLFHSLTAA